MDNHLWTEALRGVIGGRGAARCEVSERVLRDHVRCLRQGDCLRLVSGPLAGCVGILLPRPGSSLWLHILKPMPADPEGEQVESAH